MDEEGLVCVGLILLVDCIILLVVLGCENVVYIGVIDVCVVEWVVVVVDWWYGFIDYVFMGWFCEKML